MERAASWFMDGGMVMVALLIVGLLLYGRIIERALVLWGAHEQIRSRDSQEIVRGLIMIRSLVAAAPLLGLLGTVSGMILTFQGIEIGGNAEEISHGIGEALRTTQYGLAIAAPGLIFERALSRRSEYLSHHLNPPLEVLHGSL